MSRFCDNCNASIIVMAFKDQPYCSENCRKDLAIKERAAKVFRQEIGWEKADADPS